MYLKFSAFLHYVTFIFAFSPFLYTSFFSFSISLLNSAGIITSMIYLRMKRSFSNKFQEKKIKWTEHTEYSSSLFSFNLYIKFETPAGPLFASAYLYIV